MMVYPEYKDSGVEWIGEIPKEWDVERLKYFSEVALSGVDRHILEEEREVSICHYLDVYSNEVINKSTSLPSGTCSELEFEKFHLRVGNILLTKDSESPDDIGVPTFVEENLENTVCGYHLSQITPVRYNIFPKFLYRYIQSNYVGSYFETEANGITRYGLGKSSIENVTVPLPPLSEQKQISDYLDRKIQKINNLIEKTERKIELLKEQRSSLISECVTKNLDSNVEMKASGVEWIGEMPSTWGLVRGRFLFESKKELNRDLQCKNLLSLTLFGVLNKDDQSNDGLRPENYNTYQIFQKNDLVFKMIDLENVKTSRVGIVHEEGIMSPVYLRHKPIKSKIDPKFAFWFYYDLYKKEIYNAIGSGVRSSLSSSDLLELELPVPPLEEQKLISRYLDQKISKIDQIVDIETKRIDLLNEYRQSLISKVVTGKIDIRDEASQ